MSKDKLYGLLQSMKSDVLNDDSLIEKKRIVSTGSSATGSEGSVVINKSAADGSEPDEKPLRIRTKSFTKDDQDEEENDDFNDYIIEPPLPPPKDLDPGKLYALFDFAGDDPSHCELERDDAVVLLNDQDSYWWLVRKDFDGKIGFAPAECLETYGERLARLNCWKNEELERTSKETSEYPKDKERENPGLNKTVTFSNEVTVAKQVNHESDEDDTNNLLIDDPDAEGDDENEVEGNSNYNYEEERYVGEENELVSDIFPVAPLILAKKPTNNRTMGSSSPHLAESDIEESPLVAPNAFFSVNNFSGSIGSYSPSSSEFDSPGNTPPLTQFRKRVKEDDDTEFVKMANIPQSKGTRDIAHSMKLLDDLINDEFNTTASFESDSDTEEEADVTLTYDSEHRLSSPIAMDEKKKNLSNITDSTYTNSNASLHLYSSLTSLEDSALADIQDRKISNSASSLTSSDEKSDMHPEICQLFQTSLTRMESLSEKLRLLSEQFS